MYVGLKQMSSSTPEKCECTTFQLCWGLIFFESTRLKLLLQLGLMDMGLLDLSKQVLSGSFNRWRKLWDLKGFKSNVDTSIKKIILRGWTTEGVPSVQEQAAEMERVAAFEKMSCVGLIFNLSGWILTGTIPCVIYPWNMFFRSPYLTKYIF